ncbi:MAG TPA: nitrate- and nitrite sensing domain-containing protein [Actinocatenispora sp.]
MAILVLAAVGLTEVVGQGMDATRLLALARVSSSAGDLVQRLQDERAVSATYLFASESQQDTLSGPVETARNATDRAADTYATRRAAVSGSVAGLDTIDAGIRNLRDLRTSISTPGKIALSAAVFKYRILIADLISFRQKLTQLGASSGTSDLADAAGSMSTAMENLALEQLTVLRAVRSGALTPESQKNFVGATTARDEALLEFTGTAPAADRTLLSRLMQGSAVQTVQQVEGTMAQTTLGKPLSLPSSLDTVNQAYAGQRALMRRVEAQADGELVDRLTEYHDSRIDQAAIEAGAVAVTLLLAIALTLIVARGMAGSLRRLRQGALDVAYRDLPGSVARLRDEEGLGGLSPAEFAEQVRDPVPISGRDEIGQVAQAFNAVHREAVRGAAEQAALRASVSMLFVNLARRSQVMVDRLIGHLDGLESGEEDPDRLAQLFQLDHLATRMRRNNDNLLVLAGANAARTRRDAAALGDVLRAAQGEIEQYTRVEFGVVDPDVKVAAGAVNDVVHLVAELLDNATVFSRPETVVLVEACRVGNRAYVTIVDRGIGIGDEQLAELNERLASPPPVDVAASRMMGLVVVGRIAVRIGVHVELRPASGGGVLAEVVMPGEVLDEATPARRATPVGASASRRPSPVPSPDLWRSGPVEPAPAQPAARWEDPAPARHAAGWDTAQPATRWDDPAPAPLPTRRDVNPAPPAERRPAVADETTQLATVDGASAWLRRPPPGIPEDPETRWRTTADEGWRAASSAAATRPEPPSGGGLPRRQPMAELVPGAVEGPQPVARRSPEAVRGLLSAYQRGIERGRSSGPTP